jgi:hypothetical protein
MSRTFNISILVEDNFGLTYRGIDNESKGLKDLFNQITIDHPILFNGEEMENDRGWYYIPNLNNIITHLYMESEGTNISIDTQKYYNILLIFYITNIYDNELKFFLKEYSDIYIKETSDSFLTFFSKGVDPSIDGIIYTGKYDFCTKLIHVLATIKYFKEGHLEGFNTIFSMFDIKKFKVTFIRTNKKIIEILIKYFNINSELYVYPYLNNKNFYRYMYNTLNKQHKKIKPVEIENVDKNLCDIVSFLIQESRNDELIKFIKEVIDSETKRIVLSYLNVKDMKSYTIYI